MYIFWRGYGWLIPIFVLSVFGAAQFSFDAIYGESTYSSNEWPKDVAIISLSMLIGMLGYILNYKNRGVKVYGGIEGIKKSPSHTLFFIPIEFWAIIIPAVFYWLNSYQAEMDAQDLAYIESPIVNDKYLVDFTKVFVSDEEKFKYGIMRVVTVFPWGVEVKNSKVAYSNIAGVRKDIREGKTNDTNYYYNEITIFKKEELVKLKNSNTIDSVSRN